MAQYVSRIRPLLTSISCMAIVVVPRSTAISPSVTAVILSGAAFCSLFGFFSITSVSVAALSFITSVLETLVVWFIDCTFCWLNRSLFSGISIILEIIAIFFSSANASLMTQSSFGLAKHARRYPCRSSSAVITLLSSIVGIITPSMNCTRHLPQSPLPPQKLPSSNPFFNRVDMSVIEESCVTVTLCSFFPSDSLVVFPLSRTIVIFTSFELLSILYGSPMIKQIGFSHYHSDSQ